MHSIRRRLVGTVVVVSAAAAMSGCVSLPTGGQQQDQSQGGSPSSQPPGGNSDTGSESSEPTSEATSETSAPESAEPTTESSTPLEDDHGEPSWCGSEQLSVDSFDITKNPSAGSASGILTVTNQSEQPCTLNPEFTDIRLSSMDGPIEPGGPDNVKYAKLQPSNPQQITMPQGLMAVAEVRWWESGGDCQAVVQGASVQTLPEDEAQLVSSSNGPASSQLCGDKTVYVGDFSPRS